jgi:hypothetical protein
MKFEEQARQKEQGDDEAQGIDETFIDAYVVSTFRKKEKILKTYF